MISIHERRGLHGAERTQAEQILTALQAIDAINLPISLDQEQPEADIPDQLLAIADGRVIGVGYLQDGLELELYAAIDPAYRRQGAGRTLIRAAQALASQHQQRLIIVADDSFVASAQVAQALGLALKYREHSLRFDPANYQPRPTPADLHVRVATAADRASLIYLQATSFGDPIDPVHASINRWLNDRSRQYLIGECDQRPIGMLRLNRSEGTAEIHAFGVLTEWRGQGYGRGILQAALTQLQQEQHEQVMIEVLEENRSALALYQSCGFRIVHTYSYYW
jgi:mycothiol synthase